MPRTLSTPESGFQRAVTELAALCGYLVYHTYDARRSAAGFPDVVAVRPGEGNRPGKLVLAELKSARGRVRPEQRAWLDALATVPGIGVYLWRPSDWPAVVAVFGEGRVTG